MALETVIWVAVVLVIVNAVLSLLFLVFWIGGIRVQNKRQGLQRQQSEQLLRLWNSIEQLQRRQVGLVARIADKVAPDD